MAGLPKNGPWVVTSSAGTGRCRVEGVGVATGAGLVMSLTGGERPHVGAVGLGIPRPSLRDCACTSATSSVLTVTGHKDDALAKPLAERVAARLNQVAVVVVGVHVDGATAGEIALLSENVGRAAEGLLEQFAAWRPPASGSEEA